MNLSQVQVRWLLLVAAALILFSNPHEIRSEQPVEPPETPAGQPARNPSEAAEPGAADAAKKPIEAERSKNAAADTKIASAPDPAKETPASAQGIGTEKAQKAAVEAAAKPAVDPAASKAAKLDYQIKVGKSESDVVEMGQVIVVGVYGAFAEQIEAKLKSDAATVSSSVKLYLNGVEMEGIEPTFLDSKAFVPQKGADTPAFAIQFPIVRDANNEKNRKAWDTLLSRLKFGEHAIQVGVGLDNGIPHLANKDELQFRVASQQLIGWVIVSGLLLFFLLMGYAIYGTPMLRESGAGTAYSLGKTQMAFWGLLVAFSFFGVWFVGHKMERIPPSVLMLLGISGTTGLSSILIGKSKTASAVEGKAKLEAARAEKTTKQAILIAEGNSLTAAGGAGGAALTPEQAQRLASVRQQIQNFADEIQTLDASIQELRSAAGATTSHGGWFKDIISDANGASFYRFQVVLWTAILGVVFVHTVSNTFSMPEFDSTLLILMGISNGTYLGFKIPEKSE